MSSAKSKLIALAGALVLAAIVVASLVPAGMQIRTGLHWQTEHFLLYFAAAAFFCLAWPRPLLVSAALVPFAFLLEGLQGLTPDRTPDLPTALAAALGVLAATLAAYLLTALFNTLKRRKSAKARHDAEAERLAQNRQI